ncbi:hypothetical protein ABZQ16_18445 [Pseudomonas paraeruginosa]|nr:MULTISPECIES: hypothetical protein [Pseudomonas aeruginosa group]MCV2493550.1 hypothetical protein [Pseudomonas aeruginosa]MDY1320407.1 hypothetical protein [Pseudomonas paraeruginosa]QDL03187.1 hypothetical protein IHMA87_02911 [Pseudomonas aeruginosa]
MDQMECFKGLANILIRKGQSLPASNRIELGQVKLANLGEGQQQLPERNLVIYMQIVSMDDLFAADRTSGGDF